MILDTISTAILTIGNLRWKGIIAVLKLNEKIYKLGIKKTKKEMRKCEKYITRDIDFKKYSITINF